MAQTQTLQKLIFKTVSNFAVILLIVVSIIQTPIFSKAETKQNLVVSFFIIEDLINDITSNINLPTQVLISHNSDPHDFELTPLQLIELKKAKYFFYINNKFEPWAIKVTQQLQKHQYGLPLLDNSLDPHFWMNLDLLSQVINKLSLTLSDLYPDLKSHIGVQAKKSIEKYSNLFLNYKNKIKLNPDTNRASDCYLITPHGGYKYLADFFRLKEHSLFGNIHDHSHLSGSALINKIQFIKSQKCVYLFNENSHHSKNFELIANEVQKDLKKKSINPNLYKFYFGKDVLWGDEFSNLKTRPTLYEIIEHNLKTVHSSY